MKNSIGLWIGIAAGILGSVVSIGIAVWYGLTLIRPSATPRRPAVVIVDPEGSYLILATHRAAELYAEAMEEALKIHPDAVQAVFSPDDLSSVQTLLRKHRPFYTMVFILPEELDVNFGWKWLQLTTEVDDDPFVDVRTGFITGSTPEAATGFVRRIRDAAEGRTLLPGAFIDNLGPNTQARASAFHKTGQTFFLPVYAQRFRVSSISHGKRGFTRERMDSMSNAGFLHFGGHGYPDRIVDSLKAGWVAQLKLAPCIAFNGACYTGVTHTVPSKFFFLHSASDGGINGQSGVRGGILIGEEGQMVTLWHGGEF